MVNKREAGSDLTGALRDFVAAHPSGWQHSEWTTLLAELRERGLDVSDPAEIGRMLERERLAQLLGRIPRVGTQRIRSIVSRYESVWSLRAIGAEDLVESTKIPRPLAERILESV